ncbi:MAG: hypothetical protein ACOVP5_05815, partial [Chitinophagales bacterium]
MRFILLLTILFVQRVSAQNELATWICGYQLGFVSNVIDTGEHKNFGANIIDFRGPNLKITRKFRTLTMNDCNLSMCDSSGNLLFFSNGAKIFNSKDSLIEGADSLSPSRIWEYNHIERDFDYYGTTFYGYSTPNGSIFALPKGKNTNQYYIFNFYMNTDSLGTRFEYIFSSFNYSILDMNQNQGRGKVVLKEKSLIKGEFSRCVTACRKANGKDWWLIMQDNKTQYAHILTVSEDTIIYEKKYKLHRIDEYTSSGFSNDGKYYALTG